MATRQHAGEARPRAGARRRESEPDDAELADWSASFREVARRTGTAGGRRVLDRIRNEAGRLGVATDAGLTTPYVNTIPLADEPRYPGRLELERRIESLVRWNAMAMVVRANREARLGMDKAAVLGLYPDDLTTLKGSGLDSGVEVETWRVSAVTRNGDLSFTRWLYFYDGRLVELRDDRVNWDDEARLTAWRSH